MISIKMGGESLSDPPSLHVDLVLSQFGLEEAEQVNNP